MLERTEPLKANESAWKSTRGLLRIQRPLKQVVVFIEEGHLDSDFAPLIADASNTALKCGLPLHLFVDAYDLIGYAPSVRKGPTDWLMEHKARVEVQHMLVRSKLTKMGLSVASLAVGGILKGYSSRASFRLALDETLKKLQGTTRVQHA